VGWGALKCAKLNKDHFFTARSRQPQRINRNMELLNWVKGSQVQEIEHWLESADLTDDEKRSWLTNGLGGVTTLHWVCCHSFV